MIHDRGTQTDIGTPKQRIMNMIRGKPIDRLPSDIWLSDRLSARLKRELHLDDQGLRELLDNHLLIVGTLDNHKSWEDPVLLDKAIQQGYFELDGKQKIIYDSWGVGWDTAHEGIYVRSNPMAEDQDLRNLSVPDASGQGLFQPIVSAVEELGDRYCIVGLQDLTLFERACALRGFENFLVDIITNRGYAQALLKRITDYQVEVAVRIAASGVDMAFTGGDYGTQEDLIISHEDWRALELPGLLKIWQVYRQAGIPIMHHSCGNIVKVIPDLIEAGVDILNPIQHVMAPELLVEKFGQKVIFFGGIDSQGLLPFGTPEQIETEVKRYVDILGEARGYIIAPDQCLMSDMPIENILALVKAIEMYSRT